MKCNKLNEKLTSVKLIVKFVCLDSRLAPLVNLFTTRNNHLTYYLIHIVDHKQFLKWLRFVI